MANRLAKLFVCLFFIFNYSALAFNEEDATDAILTQTLLKLSEECGDGKGVSCHQLGMDYFISENYSESFKFNELACRLDNGSGCEAIAYMHVEALGTRQDYNMGLSLYGKSCDLNHAIGCIGAGLMYLHGTGVNQNLSIASIYYKKGCELGHKSSCTTLKQIQLLLESNQ